MIYILNLLALLTTPVSQAYADFNCYNSIVLKSPLTLSVDKYDLPIMSGPLTSCVGEFADYKPTSKNYSGWQKVIAINSACNGWEHGLFDQKRAIDFLLISPAVLAGKNGFIQISFQNLSEYGSPWIKTFLKCIKQ